MDTSLVQYILDIIFSKFMIYLSPMIFLFMVVLFADRLIDLIFDAVATKRRW
jgi:positive regulator of sigma E activity